MTDAGEYLQPTELGVASPSSALEAAAVLAGSIAALVLMSAPAPLLELNIAPGYPGRCDAPAKIVRVERDGSLLLRGVVVERSRLVSALGPRLGNECDRVIIAAVDDAPYGDVYGLISMLRAAGFHRIALVDRPWEDSAP